MAAPDFTCQLKGLPFKASEQEIVDFLAIDPSTVMDITLNRQPDGRLSGDGTINFSTKESMDAACTKNRVTMEQYGRWIEIFPLKGPGSHQGGRGPKGARQWDAVVKVRGLPYKCSNHDIISFFEGMPIQEGGIVMMLSERGDCNGEGYVQFKDFTGANAALTKDRQNLQGRYIEIFKGCNNDFRKAIIHNKKYEAEQRGCSMNPYNQQMQMPSSYGNMPNQMGGMGQMGQMGGGAMKSNFNNNRSAPYQMPNQNGFQNQNSNFGQNQNAYGQNNSFNGGSQNNSFNNGNSGFGQTAGNSGFGGFPGANMGQQNGGGAPTPAPVPAVQSTPPPQPQNTQPPPQPQGNNPFPHIVGMNGVLPNVSNANIQEFFRPHKAIAVNNHGTGYCDVAFKTHQECVAAMDKNGGNLATGTISLVLKSQPAAPVATVW